MNSREREVSVKQEGDPNHKKLTPCARSQWTSHKNPRIVRVSRSFGGKDRHSKVCTVRGLRDRRIRLSVPTAVQLYDLQYKLGLNQPSKVVDWLLEAAKNDVDKLPPLPGIPGAFTQFHDPPAPHDQGAKIITDQRDKWVEQENHEGFGGFVAQLSAQNLFPLGSVNQSSFPSIPYFHWDHPNPNLSLPHNIAVGGAYPLPNQAEDQSQLYSPPIIPSFPSYIAPSLESLQQNQHFSTALHLSSPMKSSFVLNVNSKSVHPQQNGSGRSGKEERFL